MEPKRCARHESHDCPNWIEEPHNWAHKYCPDCRIVVNREIANGVNARKRAKKEAAKNNVQAIKDARSKMYQNTQAAKRFAAILDAHGFNYEGKEKYAPSNG